MKVWTLLAALVFLSGLTGVAEAKKKDAPPATPALQITALEGMKLTITGGMEVTCDDKTTITRDGQTVKIANLKVGDYVAVSPTIGTPTSVTATTTAPAAPEPAKKKKKNA